MGDVFISYTASRRKETIELANDLAQRGFSVWWDHELQLGGVISAVVHAKLDAAKAVIVIWTPESVKSKWVMAEATWAIDNDKLVAVRTPDLQVRNIPPPFNATLTGLIDDRDAIVRALRSKDIDPMPARERPASAREPTTDAPTPTEPRGRRPEAQGPEGRESDPPRSPSRRMIATVGVGAATAFAAGVFVYRSGWNSSPSGPRLTRSWSSEGGFIASIQCLDRGEVLVATWDGRLRVWYPSTDPPTQRDGWTSPGGVVWCMAVLPGGGQALAGSEDGRLTLWNLTGGSVLRTFAGHQGQVSSIAVFGAGASALSGGADGRLIHWDLATPTPLRTIDAGAPIYSVAISSAGFVAAGARDGSVGLWRVSDGRPQSRFVQHAGEVRALAALPDGKRILSGGDDGRLRLWNIDTGIDTVTFSPVDAHQRRVTSLVCTPDGRFALTGSEDTTARLWNVSTGQLMARLEHPESVEDVALLSSRSMAVTASRDKALRLWQLPLEAQAVLGSGTSAKQ